MQKVSGDYDSVRIMDVNITITAEALAKKMGSSRGLNFMGATSSMWVQTADGVMAMQVRSHSVASITHGCCSSRCIRTSIMNTHITPIPTLQLVLDVCFAGHGGAVVPERHVGHVRGRHGGQTFQQAQVANPASK